MAENSAQTTPSSQSETASGFQLGAAEHPVGNPQSQDSEATEHYKGFHGTGEVLKPLEIVGMAHLILFPSGDYFPCQVQNWIKQYRASETSTIPAMERLIEWLLLHLPRQQKTTVVHGGFR